MTQHTVTSPESEFDSFPYLEISKEDAALGNVLFGAKGPVEIELAGEKFRLCFLPAFAAGFTPVLRCAISIRGRNAILETDRLPFPQLLGYPDGGLDPAEIHADMLIALFESAIEKPRAAMEAALGGEVRIISVHAEFPSLEAGRAWLCIDVLGETRSFRCRLLLDAADASALSDYFRPRERAKNPAWKYLPVTLRFRVGEAVLGAEEAALLAAGDIVLLTADPLGLGAVRLTAGEAGGPAWAATWKKTNVIVEEIVMEVTKENTDATAAELETDGAQALKKIEVPLTFDLGGRLMTLAELGGVAVGTAIPLPDNPEGRVTIRVSGKPVGFGSLIKVGGRTGVRVESLWRMPDASSR